ncbi:Na+/H+ antiporter [Flavobacterium subsaxonicum]|uniref:Sodium:hydrogen antiporter n=1 Tax=Flavobacterium subsaxonicum WB 4.1-42 = DSM 21790 TaxID=1121898 RepID=A0A0A2MI26_9FLAO|nr:Na+/H+ antiporter [Flavobacterium subsaxonicum]KGO91216.1 sodium:hydrogen antiporter [Flavobacterium subsaxonicum WB 4.1-42 = DSM 21790]
MLDTFPFYLSLIAAILGVIMLAKKIRVAYPVLLVLAGLGISFIPGIPTLHIEAELIFVIFLPPLLYEASWSISWKELWKWRRIITSFAFIVVFFTALSVALVANYFIPGFSLALGFLLGGIVSPPDAVSAGAILKFVKVPRRFSSILEGESLLNDASSLIIFRFALIAVATGQFIWHEAALSFTWMVFGGVGIGLLVGFIIMKLHKYLPTDVNSDIVLTLLTPYVIYIAAEEVHSSGVLAVVSGGLLLSQYRLKFLSSSSRLRSVNVWESLVFILNGLVFMLIGLDLPEITAGLEKTGIWPAIGYGLLITAVLIVARIVSAIAAVVTTLIARNFITVADASNPGIKAPLVLGWSGMRGVVSLAAALSIPVQLDNGDVFPQRNLILFITFVVILTTLLLQGLTLPWIIKKLEMHDPDYTMPEDEMYNKLRRKLSHYGLEQLHANYGDQLKTEPLLQQIARKWEDMDKLGADTIVMTGESKDVYRAILNLQRDWLTDKNRHPNIDEDIIRRHLLYLDLEEERIELL